MAELICSAGGTTAPWRQPRPRWQSTIREWHRYLSFRRLNWGNGAVA